MTGNPLISVIINCYNGEKYLREAIDSVIAQTYDNWELVFWDNQSTDSTRKIVESYNCPKIKYFYALEHTPLGEARNLAVEKANGEYINFLDADDVWKPQKLEKQMALLRPGKIEVVYTHFELKLEPGISSDNWMVESYRQLNNYHPNRKKNAYQNLLHKNYIIFSSVLFNASHYRECGGINGKFSQGEDYDLLLKLSLKTEFAEVEDDLVVYRIHQQNNSVKNGYIHLVENAEMFSLLPPSKELNKAKQDLEIRKFFFFVRNKQYSKSIFQYIKRCSILALFRVVASKYLNK